MDNINYGEAAANGEAKETVRRIAGSAAGTAAAAAVAEAAVAAGCGTALCTVGAPVVVGLVVATATIAVVGWAWDLIFD